MSATKQSEWEFVCVKRIEKAVNARKPGLREAYMKVGTLVQIQGRPFFRVTKIDYAALRKEFALTPRTDTPKSSTGGAPVPRRIAVTAQPVRQPPGLLRTTRNALGAATRFATAAAKCEPTYVSEAQTTQRLTACSTCDQLKGKGQPRENWSCARCGCYLAGKIFAKARLATETCPLTKW